MNYFTKKIKTSIASKLILYLLGIVLVMNVFMLVLIGMRSSRDANNFANNYSRSLSEGLASNAKVYIEQAFETTTTMANTMMALRFSTGVTREAIELIFINVLTGNDEYVAVWTIWEPFAYDGKDEIYSDDPLYEESEGRFSLSYYLDNGSVAISWGTLADYGKHYYQIPKERKIQTILNPYYRSYTHNEDDNILVTSVITPIIVEGNFLGVVGVDIEMKNISHLINNVRLFETGTASILANDLRIAAHQNQELVGKSYSEISTAHIDLVENSVKTATYHAFEDKTGVPLLRTIIPVLFLDIKEAWAVIAEVPLDEINKGSRQLIVLIVIIGISGLIIISLVVYFVAQNITKPIMRINNVVKEAALGKLNGNVGFDSRADEVGQIADGIKQLLKGLKDTAEFARKIGQGNYNEQHVKLSDDDELGEALIHMQLNLKEAKEEEAKRKSEDDTRNWITQGMALFAGIVRQNNDDVNELSYLIISNLVKYMNINQGGLFILSDENDQEEHLELAACFAFDRRKFLEKDIQPGEGLVGTCFLEGQTIYLTEVPKDYIKITSGLGEENPRALLIVPLKINDEIFGVIELAGFQPFKKHEIEFTEKVGEIIASSISNLRTAYTTKKLLEKSQQQAEELRAQEEEMRQNMEELTSTQEAMSDKDRQNQEKIRELTTKIEELSRQLKI